MHKPGRKTRAATRRVIVRRRGVADDDNLPFDEKDFDLLGPGDEKTPPPDK